MATIISVASGKGGVGKSIVSGNLGLVLAKMGKRVVLVDLDVGGADLHILFGLLYPSTTLSDFLTRRIDTLEGVTIRFLRSTDSGSFQGPGTHSPPPICRMPRKSG